MIDSLTLDFGPKKFRLEFWRVNGSTKYRVVCPCGEKSVSFGFYGEPNRNDIMGAAEYKAFETHTCKSS